MPISQAKLYDLEDRTAKLGISVVRATKPYSKDRVIEPIVIQVVRSATSVGANYAEANNASSKADFRNKIYLAKKEIAETRYWLRLLSELTDNQGLQQLQQEALELNLIFQKITSSLKTSN